MAADAIVQLEQETAEKLRVLEKRWERLQWGSLGILVFVIILAVIYGWVALSRQHSQLQTQTRLIERQAMELIRDEARIQAVCGTWHTISLVPIPKRKPTLLDVTIIVEARQAFRGLGCPGHLPIPNKRLTHWSAFYHLPPP